MSKRFWKYLAIKEFILIVLGVIALYIRVLMPGTVKEVLSIIASVCMLIAFLSGSIGWLVIIALVCDKRKMNGRV